jgi:prepilin-type N-terminal cleavage/methylation domain-containing protein
MPIKRQKIDTPARPDLKHNQGFTLLELMIATGLFVVGIVAVLQSFVASNQLRMATEEKTVAQTALSTVMDEIYRADLDTLLTYAPPAFDGAPVVNVDVFYALDPDLDPDNPLYRSLLPLNPPEADLPNPLEVFITLTASLSNGRDITMTTASVVRR